MRFVDEFGTYDLKDFHNEWKQIPQYLKDEYSNNFKLWFYETIQATLNGRNDCDIYGFTAKEVHRFLKRLSKSFA